MAPEGAAPDYVPGGGPRFTFGAIVSSGPLSAAANYTWHGQNHSSTSVTATAAVASPVQAPYETFSSATDAPAAFAQSGHHFGISGAGADLYNDADAYNTVYLPGSMGLTGTAETVARPRPFSSQPRGATPRSGL